MLFHIELTLHFHHNFFFSISSAWFLTRLKLDWAWKFFIMYWKSCVESEISYWSNYNIWKLMKNILEAVNNYEHIWTWLGKPRTLWYGLGVIKHISIILCFNYFGLKVQNNKELYASQHRAHILAHCIEVNFTVHAHLVTLLATTHAQYKHGCCFIFRPHSINAPKWAI